MHPLLKFSKTAYIQSHNLKPFLTDYTNPNDFLSRLVKSGDLIRLKNGFFLISEKVKDDPVPYEQVSNLLYGPSYVSYEWALSTYGLIPEGVYVVSCASSLKSKIHSTPVGEFHYIGLPHHRYSIGITQKENRFGNYIIATPEKALADLIHLKSYDLSGRDLLIDLIEGRRIEESDLKNLDKKHLYEIASRYQSKAVTSLSQVLGLL
ncbi:MAG: hypothetical protein NTX49_10295 [Chlamydiae bacterium]|jgi:hypothetical protein|nr:hypothetical protein [Chlamydiota bacterium]